MSQRYALVDLMTDASAFCRGEVRSVVHIVSTDAGFLVVKDGKMADALAFDEMLGQVIDLLHPKLGVGHYPMLTRDEHRAEATRREQRISDRKEETA